MLLCQQRVCSAYSACYRVPACQRGGMLRVTVLCFTICALALSSQCFATAMPTRRTIAQSAPMCALMHPCIHAFVCACVYACMHACMHRARVHACGRACVRSCVRACARACKHVSHMPRNVCAYVLYMRGWADEFIGLHSIPPSMFPFPQRQALSHAESACMSVHMHTPMPLHSYADECWHARQQVAFTAQPGQPPNLTGLRVIVVWAACNSGVGCV